MTDAEVLAFKEYETAIKAEKDAKKSLAASKKDLAAVTKAGDKEAIKAAEAQLNIASIAADEATKTRISNLKAWNEKRDAGEPAHAQLFRISLLESSNVKQLFDPWFMDSNTKDQRAAAANQQRTDNEKLHAHHLHISVDDPRIL